MLGIKTQKGAVAPAVLEGITWETERKGVPWKIIFQMPV